MKPREILSRLKSDHNKKVIEANAIIEALNALRAKDRFDPRREDELMRHKAMLEAEVEALSARIDHVQHEVDAADAVARLSNQTMVPGEERAMGFGITEPETYREDNAHEVSFFRDLIDARRGDFGAAERLQRNNSAAASRGNTRAMSSTAGAGGQFAPPGWLVDDFVALARPGRVTADLIHRELLPEGVSSVNLPKISDGTDVAVVQTQNTTIHEATVTTTSVSSGITEIAGKQTVSLALLRQSGTQLDRVILADLASAYGKATGVQVLSGSGSNGQLRGILTVTPGTTVTFTSGSPTVVSTTVTNSFYAQLLKAINAVSTTRYAAPDAIVMHPRRWSWVLGALDNDGRPLVVPTTNTNAPGLSGAVVAAGQAGEIAGLPVFVDPSIPTNLGTGTNQDVVLVLRREDLWLWETEVMLESFDATLAAQNSVLFRALGWSALIADRTPEALAVISGTGLVAPA